LTTSAARRLEGGGAIDCLVEVFPLRVARQRKKWPEKDQRITYCVTLYLNGRIGLHIFQ
jgi:hypothetical protein